jgi:hypothetical protein
MSKIFLINVWRKSVLLGSLPTSTAYDIKAVKKKYVCQLHFQIYKEYLLCEIFIVFFKIYFYRCLYCAWSVTFSKDATHYGRRSGILYYNLTPPSPQSRRPLHASWAPSSMLSCTKKILFAQNRLYQVFKSQILDVYNNTTKIKINLKKKQ